MVQAARQDDHEYVTRGDFRESMESIDRRFESIDRRFASIDAKLDKVLEKFDYYGPILEVIVDDIKPGWRQQLPLI